MQIRGRAPAEHFRLGPGEWWALASALFYALTYVLSSVAVRGQTLNYLLGVSLRATPVFLFALAMSWRARRHSPAAISLLRDRTSAALLVGSGLSTFVIGNTLMFAALHQGGVLISTPVTGTQVLWSAMLAAVLLHEPLNRRMTAAMLLSVLGVVVLTLGRSAAIALAPRWWLAIPYAAGAAFSWAVGGVLSASAMRRGADRFEAVVTSAFTALVCLNGYLLVTGRIGLYLTTPAQMVLSVLVAGLFNAAALISLTSALALTSVASATTLYSLQIGFAPLIAWLFVGERLTWVMGLGILVIAVGVIGVQRARLQ